MEARLRRWARGRADRARSRSRDRERRAGAVRHRRRGGAAQARVPGLARDARSRRSQGEVPGRAEAGRESGRRGGQSAAQIERMKAMTRDRYPFGSGYESEALSQGAVVEWRVDPQRVPSGAEELLARGSEVR